MSRRLLGAPICAMSFVSAGAQTAENFLDGTVIGKSGRLYRQGDALVLEPQLPPDVPNQPKLGSARLDPGATYRNVLVYRLFVNEARAH